MIKNTGIVEFFAHKDETYGSLVALEHNLQGANGIPFEVRRSYYIFDVPEGQRRGFHSHNRLHQMLVCVHGSVKILVKTPFEEQEVLLDNPQKGLYIGPMVWREMFDFQGGAVLLILASEHYDPSDYIRDYEDYERRAREYFKEV